MNRPTTIQPQPETARFQAQFTGPSGDVLRLPSMREHIRVSFCFALLKCGFPPAVVRRISELPVFPANGMRRARARPHVLEELRQALRPAPSIAYGYSACAILFVAVIAFAVAPTLHGFPTPISIRANELTFGVEHAIRVPSRNTSAGFRVVRAQVDSEHVYDISAVTSALPTGPIAVGAFSATDNGQAVIFLSGDVKQGRHIFGGLNLLNQVKSQALYHVNT